MLVLHVCGKFLGLFIVLYSAWMVLACDHIVMVDIGMTCELIFGNLP